MGGQAGGLARRATLIEQLREKHPGGVVLDLGNLAEVGPKYEPVVKAAGLLSYSAWAPSESDRVLRPDLDSLAKANGVPLLPDVTTGAPPFVVASNGQRIGLAILPAGALENDQTRLRNKLREFRKAADVVVLVSRAGLEADERFARAPETRGLVDLIVEADEIRFQAEPAVIEGTVIVVAARGGKSVGEITFEQVDGKPVVRHTVHEVTPALTPHPKVYALMNDFLRNNPQDAPSAQAPLPLGLWGYAPSSMCVDCHKAEVESWRVTRHAHAVETLQREGRLRPECLRCHSEYQRMTGQFALLPAGEDGVQCATCHGDALLHSVSQRKDQVFRRVPDEVCRSCHNQERDPNFEYARASTLINHGASTH